MLLEAIDVRKLYGTFCALDGVSLAVGPGEFVSIVGPNGAGKTTLVNVLSGLTSPSSGAVRFRGDDVAGRGPVGLARAGMARAFQLVHVFPALSVGETLAVAITSRRGRRARLFAGLAGDRQLWDEVATVASVFGLDGALDRPARTLPQGDKKLLDVASAFALHPEVILLDEPTSGVSTGDKHAIMEVLVKAAAQMGVKAIIQVEHDMDIVFGYSDRIVALHQGRVLADATPAALQANDEVMATIVGRTVSHMEPPAARTQPLPSKTGHPRPDPGTPGPLQ
jgi:branched-chain amino acid transport system ATP-binding protein